MKSTLGKISKINSGYFFPKKADPDPNSSIAVLFISDISNTTSIIERPFTYHLAHRPQTAHYIEEGDILIQAKGKPRVVYVDAHLSNTIASSNFFIIRSDADKVLSQYLFWFLNQDSVKQYFKKVSRGNYQSQRSRFDPLGILKLNCPV